MEKISLTEVKKNKSTFFVLPMLGNSLEWYGDKFINCYIGDVDRPEYDNCILLLFKFRGDRQSMKFEDRLKDHKDFIATYDPFPGAVMFVYNINPSLKDDYEKYKLGKYSKMSTSYKLAIIGDKGKDHAISKVLYPTDKDREALKRRLESQLNMKVDLPRDAEIASIITMENELFDKSCYCYGSALKPDVAKNSVI